MRRFAALILPIVLLVAGCADRAVLTGTPPHVLGYPLPIGTTVDLSPEHPSVTVTTGDLVTVPRWPRQYENDTRLLVLAEVTEDRLVYQALRYGEGWVQVGPIPEVHCDGDEACAIPPPMVNVVVE